MTGGTGLVVIDLQRDLCLAERRAAAVDASLPTILRLVRGFAAVAAPVFYTRFVLPPNDPQFARFGDRYCVEGTVGADLIPEVFPLQGEVIAKTKHSAFFGTVLEARLRAASVQTVVLAGLQRRYAFSRLPPTRTTAGLKSSWHETP